MIETKSMKCANNEIVFRTESEQYMMEYEMYHSLHSQIRSNQRGISKNHIALALEYGTVFYKQGLTYYVLGRKNVPKQYLKRASIYENTVVIVSGKSNELVTCYKSKHAIMQIKHKRKNLKTNYQVQYA